MSEIRSLLTAITVTECLTYLHSNVAKIMVVLPAFGNYTKLVITLLVESPVFFLLELSKIDSGLQSLNRQGQDTPSCS